MEYMEKKRSRTTRLLREGRLIKPKPDAKNRTSTTNAVGLRMKGGSQPGNAGIGKKETLR